jgi:hypothetical protein
MGLEATAGRHELHAILMTRAQFWTRPSRATAHSRCMDLVAIAVAVAFFAALLLVVEGLDRV